MSFFQSLKLPAWKCFSQGEAPENVDGVIISFENYVAVDGKGVEVEDGGFGFDSILPHIAADSSTASLSLSSKDRNFPRITHCANPPQQLHHVSPWFDVMPPEWSGKCS